MSNEQAQNTLHENGIGWGIMLIIIAVLLWLLWYFQQTEIRDVIRWIRYSEMWIASFFVDGSQPVMFNGEIMKTASGQPLTWDQAFKATAQYNKADLKYIHLSLFTTLSMQQWKLPIIGLLCSAALWSILTGPGTNNRTKLGLEGLIKRQAKNFPVIAPFVDFNPSKMPSRTPGSPVPAELPLFSEALGPEEWLAYYEVPVPDGKVDEVAAAKEFQKQLIGRWKGPKALKPHQRILLAAFCLKASRKRELSDDMLGRLALCWTHKGGLNLRKDRGLLKEANKILRSKELAGKTLAVCNRHAFVTTALLRALAFARDEGGVLAPAQFVWLRGYDRRLWYPLNNLGRHSFHMEAIGAMSHFKAERMTQRPIPVPKVENAVGTITEYMSSQQARPIPQLDYSQSSKRGVKKAV